MGLGLLIDGKWVPQREQSDQKGQFLRPETTFRHKISAGSESEFKPERGRYHLYISWACPWAHRTAIMRNLKGLESTIGLSVVDPEIAQNGWEFSANPGCIPDTVNQAQYLWQIYLKADPNYSGRVTVPVLWDKKNQTIVNNESREIMRMLDTEFERFTERQVTFYPEDLQGIIESTIDTIYQPINNGVYRAGFATTQEAYEQSVIELFEALEHWDQVLEQQPYLCGDRITEADWCFFTTLLRFDLVYYSHFKCNLSRITDHYNLWNYLKELYQVPGVAETCNFDHIKRHYYRSHPQINPTRIVPKGPFLEFDQSYDRNVLMDRL